MKVTCHVCKDEAEAGDCARILILNEPYYVHDECGLEALEEARVQKEKQGSVDPAEMSDSDFLLDLSEKLRHIPPAVAGTGQYHAERCADIAANIKNTKTRLEAVVAQLKTLFPDDTET